MPEIPTPAEAIPPAWTAVEAVAVEGVMAAEAGAAEINGDPSDGEPQHDFLGR